MKTILTSLIILCCFFSAKAQELRSYIPADVQAVVTLNGDNITSLVSVSEMNQSEFGKFILKKLAEKSENSYQNLQDLGINLERKAYYFVQTTDSLDYHYLLLTLADAQKFGNLFKKKPENIEKTDKYTLLSDHSESVLIWDNQKALVVFGDIDAQYFNDSKTAERYGIPQVYGNRAAYTPAAYMGTKKDSQPSKESESILPADSTKTEVVPTEASNPDAESNTYEKVKIAQRNKYALKAQKIDSLEHHWTALQAKNIFKSPKTNSVLTNESFKKSLDRKAEVSLWMPKPFAKYIQGNFLSKYLGSNNFLNGINSLQAHLYTKKDQIELHTQLLLDQEVASVWEEVYDSKINRKFLKYVNSEEAIGFMGYTINMEAYLKQMPEIIAQSYYKDLFGYETVDFTADLVSLLLDEEAIAEIINGDALFILNGISKKEITYTEYEYDENYRYKKVEKTKMETLPDFLMLFSTDKPKFVERVLALGIKKGKVVKEEGIYSFKDLQGGFNIYMLITKDIVFTGSSKKELQKIKSGDFKADISRKHRKLLRSNAGIINFSPKNLRDALPEEELDWVLKKFPYLGHINHPGNWYLASKGIKDNALSAKFVVETPKKYSSSLAYLLNLLEEMK